MASFKSTVQSVLLVLAMAVYQGDSQHVIGDAVYARQNADRAQTTESVNVILTPTKESEVPVFVHKRSTSILSPVDGTNPFLRSKRQAGDTCQLPANLPAQVRELNSFLNESQFVGLEPDQPNVVPIPDNQPPADQCPSESGSWWPNREEFNLRSTCPWIYSLKDFGENVYPRYVREAVCLCEDCLQATGSSCYYNSWSVTVFEKTGCEDGLAVMKKSTRDVNVGCYCARWVQSGQIHADVSIDACQLPANLPAQVRELNSFLNESQFVGLEPDQPDVVPIPDNQPPADQCPSESGSWWPNREEFNLRSTCPWIYSLKDFGENVYPRYVREAVCLCEDCLQATGSSCYYIRWSMTVFEKTGCEDGLAVMKKSTRGVYVGCYCARGVQNEHTTVLDLPGMPE